MKRTIMILFTFLLSPLTQAEQTGELWEISMQISGDDGRLGQTQIQKLCFAKGKDMKEPPEKDSSCKTTVQHSGKKSTFKSVCKDTDMIMTSTGITEELGPNHFRSDITIVTEEKGKKTQQRQVGSIKKLSGVCNPNNVVGNFGPPVMNNDPPSSPVTSNRDNSNLEPQSVGSAQEETKKPVNEQNSDPKSIIETGKDALRGLFKF